MLKQMFLILIGITLFFFLGWWLRDLRRVKALRGAAALLAIGLLGINILTSEAVFGAKNWLTVAGISIQPSELVKVIYIYVGAATLDRLFERRNLFVFIAFSALCVIALALMGDFGTAVIFFATFLVISFMRSGSFATVFLAVTGAGLAGFLVLSVKPYIAQRFASWGHVWDDVWGTGYQQTHALSAAASGGLFGQGAGTGWLKDIFAANTDMVFALLCEELGLIIALSAIIAVIALALFAVRNAAQGRNTYYVIAGCAAVSMMMVQLGLNVFGSLDILPFTGVTFPFVSKGGTSLISCWMLLAFVKATDTRRDASFVVKPQARRRVEPDDEAEEDEE
jgi:cell division protein FtsW (lipid II flippase)